MRLHRRIALEASSLVRVNGLDAPTPLKQLRRRLATRGMLIACSCGAYLHRSGISPRSTNGGRRRNTYAPVFGGDRLRRAGLSASARRRSAYGAGATGPDGSRAERRRLFTRISRALPPDPACPSRGRRVLHGIPRRLDHCDCTAAHGSRAAHDRGRAQRRHLGLSADGCCFHLAERLGRRPARHTVGVFGRDRRLHRRLRPERRVDE